MIVRCKANKSSAKYWLQIRLKTTTLAQTRNMALVHIIEDLLKNEPKGLTFEQIVSKINTTYKIPKGDGKPVELQDVTGTIHSFSSLFSIADEIVTLSPLSNGSRSWDGGEHFRYRPIMYLGSTRSKGIVNLFNYIIADVVDFIDDKSLSVEITIRDENSFLMRFESSNVSPLITKICSRNMTTMAGVLVHATQYLKIRVGSLDIEYRNGKTDSIINFSDSTIYSSVELTFELDPLIFETTIVNYDSLYTKLRLYAQLNPNCNILLRNERQEPFDQNRLCYPEGIFHQFEQMKGETWSGKISPDMKYEGIVNGNKYRIALTYQSMTYGDAEIQSSANDWTLDHKGPMVQGVIDGLAAALKKYIKTDFQEYTDEFKTLYPFKFHYHIPEIDEKLEREYPSFKIYKNELYKGLIIVCAMRCDEACLQPYGGLSRFEPDFCRADIKKIFTKLAYEYFCHNKAEALELLSRFSH